MRKIYLFTSLNDRNKGPVQEAVSPNEIVYIYIDNEFYTVFTAVPDKGMTCTGCELDKRGLKPICSIKVKNGKYICPTQAVCNYNTLLKPIDNILENL